MGPDFEKNALVPAVVQDACTGEVRMLGYMNREAFDQTVLSGELHLFSRSRGRLWRKGETSGNPHAVRAISCDCDGDAVLVAVDSEGPTCHTGRRSCFGEEALPLMPRLESVVAARKAARPEGSYTSGLFDAGPARIAKKVGEEAAEVVVAALSQDEAALAAESADLLYHLVVLWSARGISWGRVLEELARREGRRP